jgi:hypothetical protein
LRLDPAWHGIALPAKAFTIEFYVDLVANEGKADIPRPSKIGRL